MKVYTVFGFNENWQELWLCGLYSSKEEARKTTKYLNDDYDNRKYNRTFDFREQ